MQVTCLHWAADIVDSRSNTWSHSDGVTLHQITAFTSNTYSYLETGWYHLSLISDIHTVCWPTDRQETHVSETTSYRGSCRKWRRHCPYWHCQWLINQLRHALTTSAAQQQQQHRCDADEMRESDHTWQTQTQTYRRHCHEMYWHQLVLLWHGHLSADSLASHFSTLQHTTYRPNHHHCYHHQQQ